MIFGFQGNIGAARRSNLWLLTFWLTMDLCYWLVLIAVAGSIKSTISGLTAMILGLP
jgi:hypothetical protein